MPDLSIVRNALVMMILAMTTAIAQRENVTHSVVDFGQPFVTSFSPKTYHAHPNNYDVIQDKNGILYFGNLWCVLQFDGTLWRNILLPDGASCTSLAVGSDGIIYVGGRNSIGYLETDSIGRKRYVSLTEQLPEKDRKFNEVWRIAVNENGVFFASYEKLFFLSPGQRKPKVIMDIPWYVFEVRKEIYITSKEGLFVFENNAVKKVQGSEYYDGKFINGITHFDDGNLLISTSEQGFTVFDGVKATPWNTQLAKTVLMFNPTRIKNIGKNIVVATELNGVFISDLEGNILHHINKSNGLATNTVSGFYFDRSGLLWLTLYNGIAFLPIGKELSYIGDYASVTGIPYSSALYDGKLYLATSEGLFFKSLLDDLQSPFQRVKEINGLVWSLKVIDDRLFCGQAISARMIDHEKIESLFQEGTWMFHACDDGQILMGTYSGLHLLKKQNGKWKYAERVRGFYGDARNFTTDRLGDVWMSHGNEGISRLRLTSEKDSVTQRKRIPSSELPTAEGCNVARLNNDIFVTTAYGVYRYNEEREGFEAAEQLNTVLSNYGLTRIKKLIWRNQTLWALNDAGSIIKLALNNGKFEVLMTSALLKGDLITDFEHVNPMDEFAIIGTLDGFALYQENSPLRPVAQLHAFVSRVEGSGRVIADGNYDMHSLPEAIPYSGNALRFTFASNSYQDQGSNQYQYYLEGFAPEKGWSLPTSLPVKEYTNLREGNYKLHLRTVNFENHTSEETFLAFRILPPWYRSLWAYLLYGVLFVLFNFLFFRYIRKRIEEEKARVAREEQHNLWLKQKEWDEESIKHQQVLVDLRHEKLTLEEDALREKAQLLEREKEKERQILAMEKERLEGDLRHKNSELTSLTLNITQKNELLAKIGSQLNRTIQLVNDDDILKSLKEIKASLQKGLSSEQEWEKFTDHFDTVHQGFLDRLQQRYPDLSSSTLKLCAFIKMRLSSKQIASLMNTAPDSVLKARYRLRMKFNLEKDTGLEEYLNSL